MQRQQRSRRYNVKHWIPGTWGRAAVLLGAAIVASSCGAATVGQVADGTYLALVPSAQQLADDVDDALPGGVVQLRTDNIDVIEATIAGDQVTLSLNGVETATHAIEDRITITDSEGSGPFKAKKQILVLADPPLVLGGLVINEPVIWPGSFEDSPVITIKPRDPDERGPGVSCRTDESCLLLSSGVDPAGSYADINNPELNENPVDSIVIGDESITIVLDSGNEVTIPATTSATTRACALSENRLWDVPSEVGLRIDDPVLVHTLCPSTPGAGIQLIIMARAAVPTLAPLTEATEGDWCRPSFECLLFVPT